MEIKWHTEYDRYSYGHSYHLYSNVNTELEQVGKWNTCNNYIRERHIWANAKEVPVAYRNVYNPDKMPSLTLDATQILFSTDSDYDLTLDLINQIDAVLGMEPTKYAVAESPWKQVDSYWRGDPKYMHAPPLFGMWTMLLRNGRGHVMGREYTTTLSLTTEGRSLMEMVKFLVEHGIEAVFGDDKDLNWEVIKPHEYNHDYTGPLSFMGRYSGQYYPHWKFPEV